MIAVSRLEQPIKRVPLQSDPVCVMFDLIPPDGGPPVIHCGTLIGVYVAHETVHV